jgi:hypothetical protein
MVHGAIGLGGSTKIKQNDAVKPKSKLPISDFVSS